MALRQDERQKDRDTLAHDFLAFRQQYLMTQRKFAEQLGVSRRMIQYAEAAEMLPQMDTRARFRDLKREFEKRFGKQAAA